MRLVDTSAWIEGFIRGNHNPALRKELPGKSACVVPTIVQFEIAKWASRNLLQTDTEAVIAYSTQCVVIDLDTHIAVRAADYSREFKLAMADAIIYATAIHVGADLLTCDAHFKGLDRVVYLPKGD